MTASQSKFNLVYNQKKLEDQIRANELVEKFECVLNLVLEQSRNFRSYD